MSLNQKYTWNDFLKENPDFKKKELKRTSPEGKKAFEAAYKAKVKDVLKDRLARIEKEKTRTAAKKTSLVSNLKASKRIPLKKKIQKKVGRADSYLNRLEKMTSKAKQAQKDF